MFLDKEEALSLGIPRQGRTAKIREIAVSCFRSDGGI